MRNKGKMRKNAKCEKYGNTKNHDNVINAKNGKKRKKVINTKKMQNWSSKIPKTRKCRKIRDKTELWFKNGRTPSNKKITLLPVKMLWFIICLVLTLIGHSTSQALPTSHLCLSRTSEATKNGSWLAARQLGGEVMITVITWGTPPESSWWTIACLLTSTVVVVGKNSATLQAF